MLRMGEIILPREKHINFLSNTKYSDLKTYTQATLYKVAGYVYVFIKLYIHMHNCMWVTTINEER